jgi:GNAT superfamily N-acetyltransferase
MTTEWDRPVDAATIRPCGPADQGDMLAIINAAAEAYRGVIPADRWHEPYMPAEELAAEIADGVAFSACLMRNQMVGVMGVQRRRNVDLIRHAYVLPAWQGRGVGSMLLRRFCDRARRPILIGTWRAAEWATGFYQRHGFACVGDDDVAPLLRSYWNVPERQIATSVVLASPRLTPEAASRLLAEAVGEASP